MSSRKWIVRKKTPDKINMENFSGENCGGVAHDVGKSATINNKRIKEHS